MVPFDIAALGSTYPGEASLFVFAFTREQDRNSKMWHVKGNHLLKFVFLLTVIMQQLSRSTVKFKPLCWIFVLRVHFSEVE